MKSVKFWIKLSFIAIAFYILYQKIDLNELKSIKIQNYFFLFLAFIIFNISQIISAIRVHNYLKDIKVTPTFKKQLMLYYVGMFYNTLLPGGIGGDGYKAYKFQKAYKQGYKKIIKALLIDRISGLFAILVIIGILCINLQSFLAYFTLFFAPIILYILHKTLFIEFSFKPFYYSLIIQALQGVSFYFLILSIGAKSINYTLLFFISSIVSVIPVSVGGVGLRELTFLYGSEYLHLNPTIGVVGAFLFFLITLISSAIGAIFIRKVKDV